MNDSGIGKANNIKFNNHVYNWQFLRFIFYFVVRLQREIPEFTTHKKKNFIISFNNCIFHLGGRTVTIKIKCTKDNKN